MSETLLLSVPATTLEWLTAEENPAVAFLARRSLLGEPSSPALDALWARRNRYAPVARILELMSAEGSWAPPARDYKKYEGSLWQVHFLGELHADGEDERVRTAAGYAFSRQLEDGSWSCSNAKPAGSVPCLTANVARALARLGFSRDDRVAAALAYCVRLYEQLGVVDCREGCLYQLNGYCHMLTPKLLLFLAEVPRDRWPIGAEALRDECVARLREKAVFRCLPAESREFQDRLWSMSVAERHGFRERFLAEQPTLHYKDKPGWLRFGYPLSYNSDALEALHALALHDEARRDEYEPAITAVRDAADTAWRWTMRTTLNGKMLADVEEKGAPSTWLTLRALTALAHFGE